MIIRKDRYPYVILEKSDEDAIWTIVKKAQEAKGDKPGPDGTIPTDMRRYSGIRGEYIVAKLFGLAVDDGYEYGKTDLGYDFKIGDKTIDVKHISGINKDVSVPFKSRMAADICIVLHRRQDNVSQISGWCTNEEFFKQGYRKASEFDKRKEDYCYKTSNLKPINLDTLNTTWQDIVCQTLKNQ